MPTSRNSVPIAYEPPEMPPKKKYARIHHSQFGGAAKCSAGGIGLLVHPLGAEREHAGNEADDGGDEAARVPREVVAARQRRILSARQLVDLGLVHEQEEGVEAPVHLRVAAVELRLLVARGLQRGEALVGRGL